MSWAIASGETSGRSIGRKRTASAPPAIASSRASRSPALSPPCDRWRIVRAPRNAAWSIASGSGLTTSVSAIPGVASVELIVR